MSEALYRRRRFAARHRRRSPWAGLARPAALALFLVGVPIAGATWLLESPTFAVAAIEVESNSRVGEAWARAALAPLEGRHLLDVSLAEVETRLRAHPWVGGAELRKQFPNRLQVRVLERRPAALLAAPDAIVFVDRDGARIAPLEEGPPPPMVVFTGDAEVDVPGGLEVVEEWRRQAPEWAQTVRRVADLGGGDYRIEADVFDFAVLMRADTAATGLAALRRYLPEIVAREPLDAVDVRFRRQIVLQPAEAVPVADIPPRLLRG